MITKNSDLKKRIFSLMIGKLLKFMIFDNYQKAILSSNLLIINNKKDLTAGYTDYLLIISS